MAYSHDGYDPALIAEWPGDVRGETLGLLRANKSYSAEDLAVTCGLTVDEITAVKAGDVVNPNYIRLVVQALGLYGP